MKRHLKNLLCWFGFHGRMDVIQTFGSAEHIGCPSCGRRYAIHHGMKACIPWSDEAKSMYEAFGYDIDGPLAKWDSYREGRS